MLPTYVRRLSYTRSHVDLDVPVHQVLGIAHLGCTYKTREAHIQSHHYFQHKLSSNFSYESISLRTDLLIRKPVPYPKLPTCLGCDFVGEYTNTQINKSLFSVSANVFSFAHRLMCICLVRKVVLLVNTQIHITK